MSAGGWIAVSLLLGGSWLAEAAIRAHRYGRHS